MLAALTTGRNMSEQRLQQKYAARIAQIAKVATIDIIAVMADMLIFIGTHP